LFGGSLRTREGVKPIQQHQQTQNAARADAGRVLADPALQPDHGQQLAGVLCVPEDASLAKVDGEPHASLNHYSPGAVVNFLHRKVAGIEAAAPAYKRIRIRPMPATG